MNQTNNQARTQISQKATVTSSDSSRPNNDSDGFTVSAPSVSLPKGGGAIRGIDEKFTTNPATGTGKLSIPISNSPGRSGFGPKLELSYDSGAGNGFFGLGWQLELPEVTRKTDKGLPRYDDTHDSDVFVLSGAEDLVPVFLRNATGEFIRDPKGNFLRAEVLRVLNGEQYAVKQYRPRIEGLFSRIERWTRSSDGDIHWRSITQDNVTTLYGRDADSRIVDPNNPTRIFSWLICTSYDDKGNAVRYGYRSENSAGLNLSQANEANRTDRIRQTQRYIHTIQYGNKQTCLPATNSIPPLGPDFSSTTWLFEIRFDYGEGYLSAPALPATPQEVIDFDPIPSGEWSIREDSFSKYRSTFEVRTYRRCQRILMLHHFPELGTDPYLVSSTDLVHESLPSCSYLKAVIHSGYVKLADGRYLRQCMPPLEMSYSRSALVDFVTDDYEVQELTPSSLTHMPAGLADPRYRWVDLDGEGISGIMIEQAGQWYYLRNQGEGQFAGIQEVETQPSIASLASGQQLLDLAGDGNLDLVELNGTSPGFYERSEERSWEPFQTFQSLPQLNWRDPNLRFADLTGDGHADILLTETDSVTWFPSIGEAGFDAGFRLKLPWSEETGPRLIFADSRQSIFLADMTGDGLSDLVRVNQGEVSYWPNLGYGQFGPRVVMNHSPWFDFEDTFDHRRIHFVDTDGFGPADLIYEGRHDVRVYLNQSGNSWSDARIINRLPPTSQQSKLTVIDLLGRGTACLVWSSPSPCDQVRPLCYIDLMKGVKPHLLISSINNLGAETHIEYSSSTKYYLEDASRGDPWITRLPFPVHAVSRIETLDRIGRNRLITRYSYHHGYYDGKEREFRGFGRVEQLDTEELAALSSDKTFPDATNIDEASYVPPVKTISWFHTGVFIDRDHVSSHYVKEYYREGLPTDSPELSTLLLPDTLLPSGLTGEEEHEACRALRGSLLRQEVYSVDGSEREGHPYTTSERNYTIEVVQPRSGNRHAVFFTHAREQMDCRYERLMVVAPDGRDYGDPRVSHSFNLDVDAFGKVTRSLAVAYPRRELLGRLPEQQETHITLTASRFVHKPDELDWYRIGLPVESRSFELVKPPAPAILAGSKRLEALKFDDLHQLISDLFSLDQPEPLSTSLWPYHYFDWRSNASHAPSTPDSKLRLIEHVRTVYRRDDLSDSLPLGQVESLALPHESYKLAFTPELITEVFGTRTTPAVLNEAYKAGGYVHNQGDDNWWMPSGRVFYSSNTADTTAQELVYARQHFFLPVRYRNPFHATAVSTESIVRYDSYDLLLLQTMDALGNIASAGSRDASQILTAPMLDYRVLFPILLMDPNRNCSEVKFDALGRLTATAIKGKPDAAVVEGDSLVDIEPNLPDAVLVDHLADPLTNPESILQHATTRILYDSFAYYRGGSSQPVATYTLARETHDSDGVPTGGLRVRHSFSYSDGFGREIQKKLQAEPGPCPQRDAAGQIILVGGQPQLTTYDINPRWVGTGWVIHNNKGKPVRQYEPFFTDTHRFEYDVKIGVSSVRFYDPVERVVVTLNPNHTWDKVVFSPWMQVTSDVNDTVLIADPAIDEDVDRYFSRLPNDEYLPTWHSLRTNPAHSAQFTQLYPNVTIRDKETRAAQLTEIHAATTAKAHFDSLGRLFLTIQHNKFKHSNSPIVDPPTEEFYTHHVLYDIEGNEREVRDPVVQNGDTRGRLVMRYDYDLLGHRIHQQSMEAGQRWTLSDVAGNAIYSWDSRDHKFRTAYDALRRPTDNYMQEGANSEIIIGRNEYGETRPNPEITNLRGKTALVCDQAGTLVSEQYDFKGNALQSQRFLAIEYKKTIDWSLPVPLEIAPYTTQTRFDALNRPIELTTPDNSLFRPRYNEANLLERLEVNLHGASTPTPFVANIDYDAKGQRLRIDYGNGCSTTYDYDPFTFRLVRMKTRRNAASFPDDCKQPPPTNWPGCQVQNLSYVYDPAGNITSIRDNAQQQIFFQNQRVEPSNDYIYDSIYRLIEATGREHCGQAGGTLNPPTAPDAFNGFHGNLHHPGDGLALDTYTERYFYDFVGNFLRMNHSGSDPTATWEREYEYEEPSLFADENTKTSNRLTRTTIAGVTEEYEYLGSAGQHGNITTMPHLPVMQWDYLDQLQATSQQSFAAGTPEITWYVYDGRGQRVRKITERAAAAGGTPTRKEERIYLGQLEVYLKYDTDGTTVNLARETLHVMDDKQRIALVETRTVGNDGSPDQLLRYQFSNHLGSVSLELDNTGQIISYEEYFPYGSTSYEAVDHSIIAAAKRYRFTGKERDQENGFTYHGARYYAPWIGRWTSYDPIGMIDGTNIYQYTRSNPIVYSDQSGNQSNDPNDPASYTSFEEFRAGAVGPLSEEGLRSAWEESHQECVYVDESSLQQTEEPNNSSSNSDDSRLPQTAGSGLVTIWDTTQRSSYLQTIKANASEAVSEIQAAREVGDLAAAENAAMEASQNRNLLRTATQERLSPGSRMMSEALEEPRDWARMLERYQADDAFDTFEDIASASGRSRGSVTFLNRFGKVAGPIGTGLGMYVGVSAVVEASPEERPRVAAEETGGFFGGAGGSTLGMAGGTAAAGGIAGALGLSGPPGWLVLGLGIIGAGVGGYLGSEGGRAAGGAIYDNAGSSGFGREDDTYIYYPGEAINKRTGEFHLRPGPKW